MAGQTPCWYQVLGVTPSASPEEIKSAFRRAALRLHPDKACGRSAGGPGNNACETGAAAAGEEYLMVQRAWEVLQDAGRRQQYDRQLALATAAAQVHVGEAVPLAELQQVQVEGQACRAWPCRCGGSYLVLEEDVATAGGAELAVPCTTCSLHIAVLPAPAQPPGSQAAA